MADRTVEQALEAADTQLGASLERLLSFVRIPSISTDSRHRGDCRRAAEWLAGELASLGLDSAVRDTPGHPMVVAHDPAGVAGPRVLFYGHYDVQPVDPLELWDHPPFEPRIVDAGDDKHITGRGASDDKGALLTFIEACRAWKSVHGHLPASISFLFEGEEESGSPSLVPFLEANRDELSRDVVFVCDTDMWDDQTPAITTLLRGHLFEEVTLEAADRDLHSGMFGNAVRNAVELLCDILGELRGPDGAIAIPGFYDGVQPLAPEIAALWKSIPFDEAGFLARVGASVPAGEAGRSVMEQLWARPSFDICGISGGYEGEGFKAVLPAKASAKVSFRLVPGQDPDRLRTLFRQFVTERLPADCRASFSSFGASRATAIAPDGPFIGPALETLTEEWGRQAALAGTGGSIPIVGHFKRILGMDSVMVGFARFDNRVHSPNEKYDLSSFHHGIRSWVRVLGRLDEMARSQAERRSSPTEAR
ncbi:M20/M25/M40 family metallo-hydrolase [Consotaella salsifontis]|uniref:Acetylornithine deacetylase/Succinyl-diaminopimelate desuccinylase n=1 Tax=Consotaella salsifontis TaxID=1365950 RepID=A0A1T4MQK5_9HYPH|nr:M20/M25/M40 family metallo-hydrolase [Consotaella salsifontis]SJZ69243.1 Acetylornithine deacetylase/Succinyl-diaminopimelate desuccinylase [Consotaella salsifontis]